MRNFIHLIILVFSTQLNAQQYCIPLYDPDPSVFIHNFNLGDILNRNTYADSLTAYTFYQEDTTVLEIGRTYPLTASGRSNAGIRGDWGLWIDYDEDGVFSMEERIYYVENERSTVGMLEIPNDVNILGYKRIRLSYVWTSQDLDPCGEYSNGESEDYIVNFVDTEVDTDYYCFPFDALNTDEFIIDTFSFGDLVNASSGSNDYNFDNYRITEFTGNFVIGETYNYRISKGLVDNIDGGFIAWIDYNDDQIYDPSEIIFEDGPDIFSANGSVTIPIDSSFVGVRKLRVRSARTSNFPLDACLFDNGTETEEYFIKILADSEPPVAVDDLEENINVSITPNPVGEFLNVDNRNLESYNYIIYNLLGQIEKRGEIDNYSSSTLVKVQNLTAGIYVISIHKENVKKQIKFMKK